MSEYIAKEVMKNFPIRIDHYDTVHGNESFVLGIEFVLDYVESLPPADVEPVRRGEWNSGEQNCPVCGESKFKGLDADIWADWTPPYCPNCGARMSSKQEEVL